MGRAYCAACTHDDRGRTTVTTARTEYDSLYFGGGGLGQDGNLEYTSNDGYG
jgi:hypothetical protein